MSTKRLKTQNNERERGRTQSVNGAFAFLRGLIPTEPVDRKLSKIETLRLATSYIEHLVNQLKAGKIHNTVSPSAVDLKLQNHRQIFRRGHHSHKKDTRKPNRGRFKKKKDPLRLAPSRENGKPINKVSHGHL